MLVDSEINIRATADLKALKKLFSTQYLKEDSNWVDEWMDGKLFYNEKVVK